MPNRTISWGSPFAVEVQVTAPAPETQRKQPIEALPKRK